MAGSIYFEIPYIMDEYKFYSFVDDKSILAITPENKLIRIYCPFIAIDGLLKTYQVDLVIEKQHVTYFKINGSLKRLHNMLIQTK